MEPKETKTGRTGQGNASGPRKENTERKPRINADF